MKQFLICVLLLFLLPSTSWAQESIQNEINTYVQNTGAKVTVDKATNRPNFIKFPSNNPVTFTKKSLVENVESFITENSNILGIDPKQDIYVDKKTSKDAYQMEHITKQQTYHGVPVYGAVLNFHLKDKNLVSLNGTIIADIKVDPIPSISANRAADLALRKLEKDLPNSSTSNLSIQNNELYIFQKGLADGVPGPKLLVYRIEISDMVQIREFLFIDAHTGELVDQFSGNHTALNRKLYQPSYSASNPTNNLVWKEGDSFPGSLDKWQQSEIEVSGHIYNLMKNAFGRLSYDGADAAMITTHNNPGISCPNANWNGVTANYCTNVASDDVVAHEWGHAYTEYTSGLIYRWQSGALNEAYSDIWGETVDQLNNYFDENESNVLRTGCASSNRWRMGEQASAFGGAIRDMWDPTCNGHPGKVSDPQFICSAGYDGGGVHINSGVINHAYALLVDGGTYNGQTVTGLGLTKAAHIFWRAQSYYLTPTSDFANLADILPMAATDILGVDLEALSTGVPLGASGKIIDNNDIEQLNKVILAVEMGMESNCQFQTWVKDAPALCEGASSSHALLYEDFETGLNGFTVSYESSSNTFTSRDWSIAAPKDGYAGNAAFASNPDIGDCVNSYENGVLHLDSPILNFPVGTTGDLILAFDHMIASEDTWDGGNVKYKKNNGAWTLIPASAFIANPYNGTLRPTIGSDNPLAGQAAFTGSENGSISATWAQSQINLSNLGIIASDQIQIRWDFGSDCGSGTRGWFVDNVRVFTCSVTPAVHFSIAKTVMNESQANVVNDCFDYIDVPVTIQVDKAPSQPVEVTVTSTGTAKNGSNGDYIITPNVVTLSAGQLSQNVTVRVFNDANIEGAEDVVLAYTINNNGGDAYLAAEFQTHTVTILDDDLQPGNYTEEILYSQFNNSNNYWKVINGGNSADSWYLYIKSDKYLDNSGKPFFYMDSDATGTETLVDEILESPVINTSGKKNLKLTFSQDWRPYNGFDDYAETGTVEVWDGTTWQNILTLNESSGRLGDIANGSPNLQSLNIPDSYANPNMKIRFHYMAQFDYWWAIDNVKLTATNSNEIQTTVNTGNSDTQYLGPHETAVFYDPTTGNLLAKIENLSSHDYGCTTVELNRAGTDATTWYGSYDISNKTIKVTPANNSPTGEYKITLYYKAEELPNFNGEQIKSIGKTEGNLSGANASNSTFTAVSLVPAFELDYAYSATFNTGFSEFGLSNADKPLPVTLINFEGKNTNEGNLLSWTTSVEVNNDYFEIERSTNGKNFSALDKVKGKGSLAGITKYYYTDSSNPIGTSYYRLKQFDFDGSYAYSRMITLQADAASQLKVYPNPVQSLLTLEMPEGNLSNVQLSLVNSAGLEIIKEVKVSVKNGIVTKDLSSLMPGIYQVILQSENATYHSKIVKN